MRYFQQFSFCSVAPKLNDSEYISGLKLVLSFFRRKYSHIFKSDNKLKNNIVK